MLASNWEKPTGREGTGQLALGNKVELKRNWVWTVDACDGGFHKRPSIAVPAE
jgi:hypothetical protein